MALRLGQQGDPRGHPEGRVERRECELAADLAVVNLPVARHARGKEPRLLRRERRRPRPDVGAPLPSQRLGSDWRGPRIAHGPENSREATSLDDLAKTADEGATHARKRS